MRTSADTELWTKELELARENKATCGDCGNVVSQNEGFATSGTGFLCFDCHAKR